MTWEAYKVAVRLSLVSNVGLGLSALSAQFASLNKSVGTTQNSINNLHKSMLELKRIGMVGGAMAAAGGVGLSLLRGPLEEAKQFQTEIQKFKALGVGDAVTDQAVKFASGMNTFGTSVRDNLGLLRDAQTIFGDFEHAKFVTPLMAKMKFANEAMYGSEGGAMKDRAFMDMMKVIELRKGLSSEEAFKNQANMVQQVQTATGGRVGANEYLNLIKTGGVAAKSLKDDVFYYKMEPLIQEMGGNRIGTGLMSAYTNLVLGRTTVQTAQELQRLGLLDPSHIQYNKIGMIKKIMPGGLKGGDQMMQDPMAFMENVLLPAFRTKGITSESATLQELGLVFSNRTASQLFSTMFLQMANIKKNEALNRGAMGIDQIDDLARKTLAGQEMELHKKWADVMRELGTAILPIAIKAVQGLTVVLRGVSDFAREWPALTKWLTVGFGVLSGLVAAGGVLALATAGFKALGLALAMGGAGGIAGTLSASAVAFGMLAKTAGLFMAAYAGYMAGGAAVEWANKALAPKGHDSLADWWVSGDKDKQTPEFVKYKQKYEAQQNAHVYMDGKKVGEIVSEHQARAASRPMGGTSSFDGSMSPRPVGASGGW